MAVWLEIEKGELEAKLSADAIDVTLPGRPRSRGGLHISYANFARDLSYLRRHGLSDLSSALMWRRMNTTLNYLTSRRTIRRVRCRIASIRPRSDVILRTQTSPGQIRAMKEYCPEPIRVIVPGMCYRNEQVTTRQRNAVHTG